MSSRTFHSVLNKDAAFTDVSRSNYYYLSNFLKIFLILSLKLKVQVWLGKFYSFGKVELLASVFSLTGISLWGFGMRTASRFEVLQSNYNQPIVYVLMGQRPSLYEKRAMIHHAIQCELMDVASYVRFLFQHAICFLESAKNDFAYIFVIKYFAIISAKN